MPKEAKVLAAIVALVGSTALGLFGALVSLLRCDEVCNNDASAWRRTDDAWQWTAIGVLSVAVFIAAVATLVVVARGRRARAWLAVWGVLVASLLLLMNSAAG